MICTLLRTACLAALAIAILPAAAATPPATPVAAPTAAAVEQMLHVSIRDEGGRGPTVVLIPGLSTPREVWSGIVPTLRADHHVLTVQVNGFGGEAPGANLSPGILPGVVEDLHAYLARRKLTGVAVVGHSLGGLVTLMLARAHPGDVGRAMIVDAYPYIGEIFMPDATVAAIESQARMMRDAIASGYGKPANPAMAEATANRLARTPDARTRVKAWALAADPRVTAAAMYEDMVTDLRPAVSTIATPLTLVYPAESDAAYRKSYASAPHAAYVPVADSAHFVMLDQPAAFRQAVAAFLR